VRPRPDIWDAPGGPEELNGEHDNARWKHRRVDSRTRDYFV
jgi:hypothetical protein